MFGAFLHYENIIQYVADLNTYTYIHQYYWNGTITKKEKRKRAIECSEALIGNLFGRNKLNIGSKHEPS